MWNFPNVPRGLSLDTRTELSLLYLRAIGLPAKNRVEKQQKRRWIPQNEKIPAFIFQLCPEKKRYQTMKKFFSKCSLLSPVHCSIGQIFAWRDVQDLGYKKAVFGLLLDDSDTWQFLEI